MVGGLSFRRWSGKIGVAALAVVATQVAVPALGAQPSGDPSPPAGLDRFLRRPSIEYSRPEVILLGRRLFFDPALSRDSTMACASCHRPARAFSDDRPISIGVGDRRGRRNVPTLVNRGWGEAFSWDGRATTLEAQVLRPISEPTELGLPLATAIERVRSNPIYQNDFQDVLGRGAEAGTLALALAAYVRSIQAGGMPFDRLVEGDDRALSESERRGLELFRGRARCDRCHSGPLFTDESFHNTGVAWRDGPPSDSGRAAITGRPEQVGAFKTPTLREVPRTAPYMHDGSLETLEDVVAFYDEGGHPNPALDPLIRPLDLSADEKSALVSFLRSLTGRVVEGSGSRDSNPATGSPRRGSASNQCAARAPGTADPGVGCRISRPHS